jgi:hypothetical protein
MFVVPYILVTGMFLFKSNYMYYILYFFFYNLAVHVSGAKC